MWQFAVPLRKRTKAGHISYRRNRLYRPDCTSLEDRRLLSVTLTESGPSVGLVGSPVGWNAWVSGYGPGPVFQFRVGPAGGTPQVVQDFSPSSAFAWNPLQQGTYEIEVIVRSSYNATTAEIATATYTADSRVTGTSAVVSPTSNPLVALFSAPPRPAAQCMSSSARQAALRPGPILHRRRSCPARARTSSWPVCCRAPHTS